MPSGIYKRIKPVWNKGKFGYSTSKRGKKYPNIIGWNRGKKLTKEHIDKLKTSHLGQIAWNKGTKGKGVCKPNSGSFKKGQMDGEKHTMWGRKHSLESRLQMRKSHIETEKNKGKNHWNWRGGKTPLSIRIRACLEYYEWRLRIFQRDTFTCQECGDSGIRLNADHIKPLSFILKEYNIKTLKDARKCEEIWDTKNGRTLCVPCHEKTDTWGVKANNYKLKILK